MSNNSKIQIKLKDGRIYEIEATKVAEDRASYYEEEKDEDFDEVYKETLDDKELLKDWLENNMNWYELDPIHIVF